MKRLRDVFETMLGGTKERVLQELEHRFPGLTVDSLKRGWLPVPQNILEQELHRQTRGIEWVKSLSLQCVPGAFRVHADTDRWALKHRTYLVVECEQFALKMDSRVAVFSCNDPIEVEGRNFLGKMSAWLAKGIILNALKAKTVRRQVETASEGALEIDWPRIMVNLDKVDSLKSVLGRRLLGHTLLDFLSFGPLKIEQEHVQLRVGMGAGPGEFLEQLKSRVGRHLRPGRASRSPREDGQP